MNTTRTKTIKQPPRIDGKKQAVRERKGVIICPDCGNVHYKKRWWHKHDSGIQDVLNTEKRKVLKMRCPACAMARSHLFEGELLIMDIPKEYRTDLAHVIKNFAKAAEEKDPQDRMLTFERTGDTWRVTTTENQMVNKLARKIRHTFNKVKVRISYSREPYEVGRVRVCFIAK